MASAHFGSCAGAASNVPKRNSAEQTYRFVDRDRFRRRACTGPSVGRTPANAGINRGFAFEFRNGLHGVDRLDCLQGNVDARIAMLWREPVTLPLLAAGFFMAVGLWLHLSEHHAHLKAGFYDSAKMFADGQPEDYPVEDVN